MNNKHQIRMAHPLYFHYPKNENKHLATVKSGWTTTQYPTPNSMQDYKQKYLRNSSVMNKNGGSLQFNNHSSFTGLSPHMDLDQREKHLNEQYQKAKDSGDMILMKKLYTQLNNLRKMKAFRKATEKVEQVEEKVAEQVTEPVVVEQEESAGVQNTDKWNQLMNQYRTEIEKRNWSEVKEIQQQMSEYKDQHLSEQLSM